MGKRIAALVLAACMALPLFGCGSKRFAIGGGERHVVITQQSTIQIDGD